MQLTLGEAAVAVVLAAVMAVAQDQMAQAVSIRAEATVVAQVMVKAEAQAVAVLLYTGMRELALTHQVVVVVALYLERAVQAAQSVTFMVVRVVAQATRAVQGTVTVEAQAIRGQAVAVAGVPLEVRVLMAVALAVQQ